MKRVEWLPQVTSCTAVALALLIPLAGACSNAADSADTSCGDDNCGGSGAGGPGSGPGGPGSGAGGTGSSTSSSTGGLQAACTAGLGTGFSPAPASYAIPAARCAHKFDALSGFGTMSYTLVDMVGDRHPDLVVTKDDCDPEVGSSKWDVYVGGPSGLSAAPTSYNIPAPRCQSQFEVLAGNFPVAYALVDMTGDGHPDLVVTKDKCDAELGRSRWDVYVGGSSGFSLTPTSYTIPAPRCQSQFEALAANFPVNYALVEITGDAHPDLVVTKDNCDSELGRSKWDVYVGGPSGFSLTPTSYTIPAPRCQSQFEALAANFPVNYAMVEITGDAHPDLVVTKDNCDAELGRSKWDVYVGGPSGFPLTPTNYGTPAPRCQSRFEALAGDYPVNYALVDFSCDGRPDLVVTQDECDADLGRSKWDVHVGGPSGFSLAPTNYSLPAPRCQSQFEALAGDYPVNYALVDMTADRRPDLVVTKDECDAAVGTARWDVYATQ